MPKIAALFANSKEYSPTQGRIKGKLPEWLEGSFIRNGPGIFDIDDGNYTVNHFFDGFAMVCKFEIKSGQVIFQQRILETEAYKRSLVAKKNVYAEFGTKANPDPTRNVIFKVLTKLVPIDLTDNTVGNSYCIEGECFSSHESCFIHRLDTDSLQKKERYDFMSTFGTMMMCAHPLTDSDGVTWNIGASMLSGCKYQVIKIPPSRTGQAADALKHAKVFATIPSSWKTCASYFHSFAMTKNYIIFMEQPMLINCVKLAQMGIKGKSLRDAFEWIPAEKNRLYIMEKSTGNVLKTKYRTEEAYFSFHYANAYEMDDQIVLDMVTYPSPLVLEKFNLSKLRKNIFAMDDPAQLNRFVLPIITTDIKNFPENENLVKINGIHARATRTKDGIVVVPQSIAPPGMEFPRFNPDKQTKPYRYIYATGSYDVGFYKNSICKIDVTNGDLKQHKTNRDDEFFGEPLFIPKPGAGTEEDEGVVLSAVSCGDVSRPDYLIMLDASTFKEIGRAEFDAKFLQTLHGTFIGSCQ